MRKVAVVLGSLTIVRTQLGSQPELACSKDGTVDLEKSWEIFLLAPYFHHFLLQTLSTPLVFNQYQSEPSYPSSRKLLRFLH